MAVFPELNVLIGFLAAGNSVTTAPYITFDLPRAGVFNTFQFAPDYTWTDVTADVRSLTTTRGRQRQIEAFAAGNCTLVLDNNAGTYDPDNPNSPLNSVAVSVLPMRPIQISASWNGTNYPIFYGYIDAFQPDYAPGRYSDAWCTVTASDATKVLQNIPSSGSAPAELTSARITRILDNSSWPAALRTIATGDCVLQATTLSSTVAQDIQASVDSEYGRWYIGTEGDVIFENRSSRSGDQVAVSTWKDNNTGGGIVLSTDTFNRANGATIPTYLGSTNGAGSLDPLTWLKGFAGTTAGLGITSNAVADLGNDISTPHAYHIASVNLSSPDVDISVSVTIDNQTGKSAGLLVRYLDDNNFWTVQWAALNQTINIYKTQAGIETLVTSGGSSLGLTGTLRVVADGSGISAYAAGTLVASTTSSFNGTATKHGLAMRNDPVGTLNGSSIDNWSATGVAGLLYSSIGRTIDDDLIRNQVSITNIGGTEQTLTDATSITQYQARSFSASNLLLQGDSDAYQLANIILYDGKQLSGCRFDSVMFEPVTSIPAGTAGDLWPEVLGRAISDRVAVVVTPPYVSPMTMGAFVEGVSHSISTEPQNWTTTFHASRSAPTNFIQFNDAVFGITFGGVNTFGR